MKLFSRSKEPTDPATIIGNCLTAVVNRISDSLNEEEYHWNKPWGVKRFESIILAKFLMDYSFNSHVEDKLKEDERTGYEKLSNAAFSKMFDDEFAEAGINYEAMQGEITKKIESYLEARKGSRPPKCYHDIYTLITRTKPKEEIEEEISKKKSGLDLIRGNEAFAGMVPQYESQIKILTDKASAFESAEMMLPHMVRFTKDKLRAINLKKIKALSKKKGKKDKGKKDKDKKK